MSAARLSEKPSVRDYELAASAGRALDHISTPRVAVTQLSADTLCDILGGSNHSASVAMLHALDNAKAEEIVEQAVTRGIGVGDLLGGEGDAAAPENDAI